MALQLMNRACRLAVRPNGGTIELLRRHTHFDQVATRKGQREVVGYGWNGSPGYYDRVDYPFPAVRFQEPSPEICALREKEQGDWKKMSVDEKKLLYRYSFCQTFEEMKAPTSDWKFAMGVALIAVSIGILYALSLHQHLYGDLPPTFEDHRRRAQLKRILALEMNPVQGLSSKWDYERNRWK